MRSKKMTIKGLYVIENNPYPDFKELENRGLTHVFYSDSFLLNNFTTCKNNVLELVNEMEGTDLKLHINLNAFKAADQSSLVDPTNKDHRNQLKTALIQLLSDIPAVDGIIFDLGLSSDQLENSGRGFSFLKDERLLMTMKEPANTAPQNEAAKNPSEYILTAREIVNDWSEKSLADIIFGYGEEKYSRKIAKGIIEARKKAEIKTTFDLVKIIEGSVPVGYRKQRLHFATRTFQALRIATNDELNALQEGLLEGFKILKIGGRMSTISFHSLEDRIVKKFSVIK